MHSAYPKEEHYYIYMLLNKSNKVIYVGITNSLFRRVKEHKDKKIEGFTKKYNIDKLVYYEMFYHPQNAIAREKQIKGWKRERKDALIKTMNPELKDLAEEWYKQASSAGLKDPSSLRSSEPALSITEGMTRWEEEEEGKFRLRRAGRSYPHPHLSFSFFHQEKGL